MADTFWIINILGQITNVPTIYKQLPVLDNFDINN